MSASVNRSFLLHRIALAEIAGERGRDLAKIILGENILDDLRDVDRRGVRLMLRRSNDPTLTQDKFAVESARLYQEVLRIFGVERLHGLSVATGDVRSNHAIVLKSTAKKYAGLHQGFGGIKLLAPRRFPE